MTAFSIDPGTGAILLADHGVLSPQGRKEVILAEISDLVSHGRDHANGYEWLHLEGLSFGGESATLAICFLNERLEEASWSVQIKGAPMEGGWPTKEAIDSEVSFVRKTLAKDGISIGPHEWGEVWSYFDARGFLAANGLRYRSA